MKVTFVVLSLLVTGFVGSPTLAAADGKALYDDNCSSCHGERGEGNVDMRAPVLAGYSAAYLTRQINHFRAGTRTGDDELGTIEGMIDTLKDLSEGEIEQITGYLATLDIPALEQETKPIGFSERGLFSQCSSCHEADASGNEPLGAPRLTGQYGWYLKSQLVGFRAGRRGTAKEDKHGRQMKAMADVIASEADIDTLVNYLLVLGKK